MDPPPPGDPMDEDDVELQLALALSLQDDHVGDVAGADNAGAGPSSNAPAAPSVPSVPAPAMAPGAITADSLGALLAAALQGAAAQGLLPSAPPAPAPAPAAPAAHAPAPAPAPAPPPPAPAPAPAPPAAPAAAAAGNPFETQMAAAMQQFLNAFAAGQLGGPPAAAAGGGGGGGGPHQLAQQQRAAQPGGAGGAGAFAAAAAVGLPAWAQKLGQWWQASKASPAFKATSVTLASVQEVAEVAKHLSPALGVKVVSESSAIGADTLFLKTTAAAAGGASRELFAADVSSLVSGALARRKVAAKERLQALHKAHDELPAGAGLAPGVAGALDLACGVLCREALKLLKDDGADLYYDVGQQTSAFLDALAGGQATMCLPFLDVLLDTAVSEPDAAMWQRLLRDALKAWAPCQALTDPGAAERPLAILDAITQAPRMLQALASLLAGEVQLLEAQRASPAAARSLEAASVLGPMLSVSPMPAIQDVVFRGVTTSPARKGFTDIRGYGRNMPGTAYSSVLAGLQGRVALGAGEAMLRLSRSRDGGACREALLSWVAAVGRANAVRCNIGEGHDVRSMGEITAGGSDGFLLNLLSALLRMAAPFTNGWLERYSSSPSQGPSASAASAAASSSESAAGAGGKAGSPAPGARFGDLLERHLRPEYYVTQHHRLGDLSSTAALAGARGTGVGGVPFGSGAGAAPPALLPALGGEGAPSFMADVFFLTQLLLHVGAVPAVNRYHLGYHYLQQRLDSELKGVEDPAARRSAAASSPLALEMALLVDCCTAQLLEPAFADSLTAFAVLTLDWLAHLVSSPPPGSSAAQQLLLVPEYALADALDWLSFLVRSGKAELVAAKPVRVIIRALVVLLEAGDAVRSPLLHNKLVNLLLAMISAQLSNVQAAETTGRLLAPDRMSTGERALVAAVLGTPTTQKELVPALLRAYVQADLVVGLDVDKDKFDKYSMRQNIDVILSELFKDAVIRQSLVALALAAVGGQGQGQGGQPANLLFADYVSTIVNGLIHLFKDALDRLQDIYKLERSKADTAAWAAQPEEERRQKESFYAGQQRAARGFLASAVANLEWLRTITGDATIASAFLRQPLCGKAAFACLSFIELLLGPRCQELQVERPEQYRFDIPALMASVLELMLALGRDARFVRAVTEEPDYDDELMERAQAFLERTHMAGLSAQLQTFRQQAAEMTGRQARGAAPGPAGPSAAAGGEPGGSDAEQPPPLKRRKSCEGGAEPMDTSETGPSLACMALPPFPEPCDAASLEERYRGALGGLAFETYDSGAPGGYARAVADEAARPTGDSKAKMKRLQREVRDMQPGGKTPLPVQAAASVFVRQDEERLDKMRAVITGPQDTPYEGGLFIFDVFFPDGYPAVSPVMVLYNTGDGRGRFNPNLYADGKVCLSLLGTWHSTTESEKWSPEKSSLFQVLLSIQAQVLVEDPYFNEPSYEQLRNSPEGRELSGRYNSEVQLYVMRYAMADVLKRPPPGCGPLVAGHFGALRGRLWETVRRWVRDAPPAMQRKLDAAAVELHGLLAKL